MITQSEIANVLMFSAVLAMWSLVIFKVVPEYRVDCFRQKMFCVRDSLFDFAAAGKISFHDPAYILLRQQLNGFIRYGHQITVFRLLMTKLMNIASGTSESSEWSDAWHEALEGIESDDVRNQLRAFHHEGTVIAIKHLLIGSPFLWIAIGLVGFCLLCHGAAQGTSQLFKTAAKKVMVGPFDRRQIEEAAAAYAR